MEDITVFAAKELISNVDVIRKMYSTVPRLLSIIFNCQVFSTYIHAHCSVLP